MAGIQLASFYLDMAPASPRSPRAPFAAVTPSLLAVKFTTRRNSISSLDPIMEEDGLMESTVDAELAVVPMSLASSTCFHRRVQAKYSSDI